LHEIGYGPGTAKVAGRVRSGQPELSSAAAGLPRTQQAERAGSSKTPEGAR
jgi:hypothetical protein